MKKALLFLILFVGACSDNDGKSTGTSTLPDGTVYTKNFVQTYVIPNTLSAEVYMDRYIQLKFSGSEIHNMDATVKNSYDALSEKYKDTSYNNNLVAYSTFALGPEYSVVNIICDKAIDEKHAAGASLNDVIKICAISFNDFVKSKYDSSFITPPFPAEFESLGLYNGRGAMPVFKLLAELDKEDLLLVSPTIYLYFTQQLKAGQYEFTITVNSADGNLTSKVNVSVK